VSSLLAPVVQRRIGDGHDLRGNRFAGNAALEATYDRERTIGMGHTGLHVTIVQQALADAGFTVAVTGRFTAPTRAAVRAFQTTKGLSGSHLTGAVDARTMDLLDRHFRGHAPERDIARDPGRALLDGTRALSAAERRALERAITTEQRAPGGRLPVFRRRVGGNPDPYEVRLRRTLDAGVTALHASLVTSRPARTPANLMTPAEIDRIAGLAKRVTDGVFGRYRVGPPLAYGVNIRDQFDVRDAEISVSAAGADAAAEWRVDKLLSGEDTVKALDREHGAVQSRAREARLVGPVRAAVIASRRAELLAIHRNWPASAGGGEINLQRYRGPTAAANRDILWDLFSTVIHEYVHTLEASAHVTHRRGLPEQRGGFVLREGMTDYFAKMVWDGLAFTPALRSLVEGAHHDRANPTAHTIPAPARYDEWVNAERAVGIIGVRNAMAAFFLGRDDLIRTR
jgi:peptidoglycan hydrolase-like protein with peptidoglycan-binding domain